MKPSNKTKRKYEKLVKEGYYIKPCKYNNTTIYSICKDLNPVKCLRHRTTFGSVNIVTANMLINLFSFKMKSQEEYFGTTTPIANYLIIQ